MSTDPASVERWKLREAQAILHNAQYQRNLAVAAARRAGASWAEIGRDLGMHRQNAQRKFGPAC